MWADEYAKRDPKGFETYVASAVPVVPVGERPGGVASHASSPALDEVQVSVNKAMGVDDKKFETFYQGAA